MENRKRKTEYKSREFDRKDLNALHTRLSVETLCPACGSHIQRSEAKFCNVCGKFLPEDYQPLDSLKASYRLQGRKSLLSAEIEKQEITDLFEREKNNFAENARACVVYAMVPYLGILFCPLAFMFGGFGIFISYRKPVLGGRKTSVRSIVLGFVVLAVQVFLWWLLYFIPELGIKI